MVEPPKEALFDRPSVLNGNVSPPSAWLRDFPPSEGKQICSLDSFLSVVKFFLWQKQKHLLRHVLCVHLVRHHEHQQNITDSLTHMELYKYRLNSGKEILYKHYNITRIS